MKMTGEQRVRFLLAAIPYYRERQYSGNYYDNDDVNDILDAIERAELTDKQREIIKLTFIDDTTHREAGKKLGIARTTVTTQEDRAVKKITEAYEKGRQNELNGT